MISSFGQRFGKNPILMLPMIVLFLIGCALGASTNQEGDGSLIPEGQVYYVSPTGDDANPGTREQPWAHPGNASRLLEPGDTLMVMGGTYVLGQFDQDILIPPSGAEGKWIRIIGEEGNRPILAGENNLYAAVILDGVRFVHIENIEITSYQNSPFRDGICGVGEPLESIILKHLHIHHIDEFGINLRDIDGLLVEDCIIEYCGFGSIGGPTGRLGGWRNIEITRCQLSYSGHYYRGIMNNPALPYDRPDGFGIEPSEGPIKISYTQVLHNRGDGIDSKARNTFIHHCVVGNNYANGIKLWGGPSRIENTLIYGTGDGDLDSPWPAIVIEESFGENGRFTLTNITVHDHSQRRCYMTQIQYDSAIPIELEIVNCIFSHGYGALYIGPSATLIAKHNIFFRPNHLVQVIANGTEYTVDQIHEGLLGEENRSVDPLFENSVWGAHYPSFQLKRESPGVDTGTMEGAPKDDLIGILRPQGEGVDRGCYESH